MKGFDSVTTEKMNYSSEKSLTDSAIHADGEWSVDFIQKVALTRLRIKKMQPIAETSGQYIQ